MTELSDIISPSNAKFSRRFSRKLLDRLMYVGDPVADAAIAALKEEAYDPDGSQLQTLRALATYGEPRAKAFFERAEHRPEWFDADLLERGQRFARAFSRHYGMSLMHSLFSGAIFSRATLVTNSTGRLGSNPARRIQETGAFLASVLRPGGLEPGALGFETAVRVRLLHASIRSWLKKSPGFSEAYVGEPLDQTMLAMTLGLFDYLNVRSIRRLGVPLAEEDVRAHHHMWRYIGYLLGIDERLLTDSIDQERELWSALVAHQAFPDLFGENYLETIVRTVGGLTGAGPRHRDFIRTFFVYLSGREWYCLDRKGERDRLLDAFRAATLALGAAHRWFPGVSIVMERHGAANLSQAEKLAHDHRFGVTLEVDEGEEERQAIFEALAAGVKQRFVNAAPAPH
jgi:hypothetical protein